ncbi:MAG: amidohydrolase family protein [Planctomycetota bacterium]|jgi:guanine deaminase
MLIQGRLLSDPRQLPVAGWIRIDGERIAEIGAGDPPAPVDAGSSTSIICPGFVDAHLHLPQFDVVGCDGLDLLDWLDRVVYPAEIRWSDPAVADAAAADAYRRLLDAGTLAFAGYLTSHHHSLVAAIRAAHRLPLRAIVGQVLMDREAPAALFNREVARLARSERGRLDSSVNPRFAVSCTDQMLAEAARRAPADRFVQTHLAESIRECERVAALFPEAPHYAGVYDRHGLLTERTLLAHCLHLSDEEWALIARRRSVVVHCPPANTFLQSGLFDLARAARHGVRLALGSDVAAGPDIAMPRVARSMIEVAKHRRMTVDPEAAIPSPAEAWDLITRGNADALGLGDAGRLERGAAADLLVLDLPFEPDEHLIGRLLYTWRTGYIATRIVAGRVWAGEAEAPLH